MFISLLLLAVGLLIGWYSDEKVPFSVLVGLAVSLGICAGIGLPVSALASGLAVGIFGKTGLFTYQLFLAKLPQ